MTPETDRSSIYFTVRCHAGKGLNPGIGYDITLPETLLGYTGPLDCTWAVTASITSFHIAYMMQSLAVRALNKYNKLNVPSHYSALQIHEEENCTSNYLELFDHSSESSIRSLGKYCGTTLATHNKTSQRYLFARLITEGAPVANNFSILVYQSTLKLCSTIVMTLFYRPFLNS